MQLLALCDNQDSLFVLATKAQKHANYRCPECHQPVRLRSGPHRQPHFYHLHRTSSCRQNQKSLEHLHAQLHISSLLGEEACAMEHPFPAIGRIADLFWRPARIVFEVQCSPISLEEVQARTRDYLSLGLEIVWILHEKNFNGKKLSAAEGALRRQPCYFTNIDAKGKGIVFDQFEVCSASRRHFKGPAFPLELQRSYSMERYRSLSLPPSLFKRLTDWKIGFEGDLIDRLAKENAATLQTMQRLEHRFSQREKKRIPLLLFFKKAYWSLFFALLRRFC